MKEYTITFKNGNEEYFKSKREAYKRFTEAKDSFEQFFYKTYFYNRNEKTYEEKDCVIIENNF